MKLVNNQQINNSLIKKPPDELHSQSGGKDKFKILWVYFIITKPMPMLNQ